jgi:23S rRNA-/tRNA-specific pseudouridylate synthase
MVEGATVLAPQMPWRCRERVGVCRKPPATKPITRGGLHACTLPFSGMEDAGLVPLAVGGKRTRSPSAAAGPEDVADSDAAAHTLVLDAAAAPAIAARPPVHGGGQKRRAPNHGGRGGSSAAGSPAEVAAVMYIDADGRRCVQPYMHTYTAFAKARWLGKRLFDMFCADFGSHDAAYFAAAIERGCITVRGRRVGKDYVIRHGDFIEHRLHRHEPRVPGAPVRVLHVDDELVVACKPSGMPVHACGPYHHACMMSVLAHDSGGVYGELAPVHRLDRLTSGLVILARTKAAATRLCAAIKDSAVQKRYVARVTGVFPLAPGTGDAAGSDDPGAPPRPSAEVDATLSAASTFLAGFRPALSEAALAAAEAQKGDGEVDGVAAPLSESKAVPKPSAEVTAAGGGTAASTLLQANAGAAAPPAAWRLGWTAEGYLVADVGLFTADNKNARQAAATEKAPTMAAHGGAGSAAAGVVPVVRSTPSVAGTTTTASSNGGGGGGGGSGRVARPAKPSADGAVRDSVTLFRRLAVTPDGRESIVECRPLSGRTHQIRVHLAWLGFPIGNDPLYNPAAAAVVQTEFQATQAVRARRASDLAAAAALSAAAAGPAQSVVGDGVAGSASSAAASPMSTAPADDATIRSMCVVCRYGEAAEFNAMHLHCDGIWLHSCEYAGPGWRFSAPLPDWAAAAAGVTGDGGPSGGAAALDAAQDGAHASN